MTDHLLQKLEEKVMILLTELEDLRGELNKTQQENALLKAEKITSTKKLQGLISVLDSLENTDGQQATQELPLFTHSDELATA